MLGGIKRSLLGKVALVAGAIVLFGTGAAAAAPAHRGWGHGGGGPVVVTSVNGVSTAGTCGVAAASGTFTVVGPDLQIVTVDVTAGTTTFTDSADTSPSFHDVCVAVEVIVNGAFSSGTISASSVTVVQQTARLKGVVTSVNGTSTSGTCGSAGAAGVFTMVGKRLHIRTVDVGATTTTFTDVADPMPSFADVCVGNRVVAQGTVASGVLTASSVIVLPPNLAHVIGVVTSVNGTSTSGTCGTADTAGTFGLVGSWRHGIINGAVKTTTTFVDSAATTTPSFADICVGTDVAVLGTFSSGTLTASKVSVIQAGAGGGSGGGSSGGHRHRGHGHHGHR